jgi:hypothetical protein
MILKVKFNKISLISLRTYFNLAKIFYNNKRNVFIQIIQRHYQSFAFFNTTNILSFFFYHPSSSSEHVPRKKKKEHHTEYRKARLPEKVAGALSACVFADDLFLNFCFFCFKTKERILIFNVSNNCDVFTCSAPL